MTDDNLGLADDELWSDRDSYVDRIVAPLVDQGLNAERIAAPSRVPLNSRETLPVAVVRVAPARELGKHPIDAAVVTAVDLDTGALSADLAFSRDNQMPMVALPLPPEFAADAGPEPGGVSSLVKTLDARERLDVEWRPGKYLLTLLLRDHVSNRRAVELVASPSSYEDPAVKALLEQERIRIGPPAAGPRAITDDPLAHFRKRADSPAPPGDAGIVMSAPRVFVLGSTTSCVLVGAFRVPLARHQIVPRGRTDASGNAEPYRAVVPLALLLTGSQDADPVVIPMQVPVFDEFDPSAPPATVTGYFAVDLLRLARAEGAAQTYFVYAFAGEVLGGPVAVAFVPSELLPRR